MAGPGFALALSALFGLCAPAMSDGALARQFPSDLLHRLEGAELKAAVGEPEPDAAYWSVDGSGEHFIVQTTIQHCRVTEKGDPKTAMAAFRAGLDANGWAFLQEKTLDGGLTVVAATRDVAGKKKLLLSYTTKLDVADYGFFGSVALVEPAETP